MTEHAQPAAAGSGRTIVITGAGRGLGLGLAQRFVERGDRVIGTVRNREAAAELTAAGAEVVELDVASDRSIAAAAGELEPLGHIDVLINNAGIDARSAGAGPDSRGPLEIGRVEMLTVLDVNVAGPLLVIQALLPLLRAAEEPLVVNISSQLGAMSVGGTGGRDLAYNCSKAALNMVTVRTATELASDRISLVSVHPGWVKTDMGGQAAALTIAESSTAIAATVDSLTFADSGRFMRWDGTDHAW